ncbi:MAG: class I SAM-dependent methyltransferase [Erysipelotrichaceae bacterium]
MLDDRLNAILHLIAPCKVLADVGTDHAYIPLEALKQGLCAFAYAADIKPGPLKHAQDTFAGSGLEEQVRFVVCDGISTLPDPLDAVVIAGLGAETILQIIRNDVDRFKAIPQIILQANKDVHLLRKTMLELGFDIVDEEIAFLKHYYVAVKFMPQDEIKSYSAFELKYGPILLAKREDRLISYLHLRFEQLRSLAKHITASSRRSAFLDEAEEIRFYLDKEN